MTLIKRGGQLVGGGTFFSLRTWEFITQPHGHLPGTRGRLYLQVPAVLVLFLGPMTGLFLVILLPLAGIVALPVAIGKALYLLERRLSKSMRLSPLAAHPKKKE